jgi:hypothetical protein
VGGDTNYRRHGASLSTHLAQTFPDVWGPLVRPVGRRSSAETAALQAKAGFILVPSTWDVFNLAAVEGMGRGKVVLCSEGAGAAQLIQDGLNGFRFPATDEEALAECVHKVRELGPREKQQIGEAARETVRSELDPGRVAEQRLERYRLLAGRSGARPGCHPWKREAASGGEACDQFLFLDRLPLRKLARNVARRTWRRLLGRSSG